MSEDLLKRPQSFRAVSLFLVLILGIAVLFFGVFAVGYYGFGWSDDVTSRVVRGFRYPAALVDGIVISVNSYVSDVETLTQYYAEQKAQNPQLGSAPAASELQTIAINRAIRDAFTIRLAQSKGIHVSSDEVAQEYQRMVDQAGGDATYVASTIDQLYGWTPEVFQEKVIRPFLFRAAFQDFVARDDENPLNREARSRAEEVFALVQAGDRSFEDLAREYSEDTTAAAGGDLGFFGRGEMVKEFEDAAFALEPGEVSGIVRTQFGFHIIRVDQKVPANEEEGTPEQVSARHILIRTQDFDEYLTEQLANARVYVFLPGFSWDKEKAQAILET